MSHRTSHKAITGDRTLLQLTDLTIRCNDWRRHERPRSCSAFRRKLRCTSVRFLRDTTDIMFQIQRSKLLTALVVQGARTGHVGASVELQRVQGLTTSRTTAIHKFCLARHELDTKRSRKDAVQPNCSRSRKGLALQFCWHACWAFTCSQAEKFGRFRGPYELMKLQKSTPLSTR